MVQKLTDEANRDVPDFMDNEMPRVSGQYSQHSTSYNLHDNYIILFILAKYFIFVNQLQTDHNSMF